MGSPLTLKEELRKLANPERAKNSARYFKTGKGEYGEGDKFLGITVPEIRKLVKNYRELDFSDIDKLLHSQFHEERLLALLILVSQFEKGDQKTQEKIFAYYLANTKYINNWDLVDLTAPNIIGEYLRQQKDSGQTRMTDLLYKLAKSKNLWERRISIIAAFAFIRNNSFDEALKISEILLHDKHDLIHKAVGWMLREIGKRNQEVEKNFLDQYAKKMPRTMLRYSLEKFSAAEKKDY